MAPRRGIEPRRQPETLICLIALRTKTRSSTIKVRCSLAISPTYHSVFKTLAVRNDLSHCKVDMPTLNAEGNKHYRYKYIIDVDIYRCQVLYSL
jgi:hypothetical protein